MDKKKQSPLIFCIFYFVVFLGNGIQGSFLSLYLSNAGMQSATIGVVNGIIQVISLATFPMWGMLADRASSKNKVLIIEISCCIIMLLFFSNAKTLLMLGIAMILFSVTHDPLAGIYETITMEHVMKNGWNYNPIRMSGTIGYSIMSVIAGFWLSKRESMIFPIYITATSTALICAFLLPKTKGRHRDKPAKGREKKKSNIYVMLKNKRVRSVLILFMTYNLCNAFNRTYFGIYITSLGGNYNYVGIANMIMGFSEIPFYLGPGRKWMKKLGVEKSLLITMAAGTVRFAIAALCHTPWVLVITMAFNGVMLVPTVVGLVEFLYENAPDDLKTSAQNGLKSPFQIGGQLIANLGLGRLIGVLDGAGYSGIRIMYACLVPLCLIMGLVIGIPIFREDKKAENALPEA